ncbi:serine/threonine-protein kinase [Urbifossiella limnaea]|uniref:non-specific serine/threonine protein kinase n=1 Tax=Urbifossiella limnaea TaxID=2528023 RepID=A0A517XMU5_9BACT|nr:serine/threonine-protein kinase [Urbifossiella limnaea]QDU18825.1 Serine/threonine-protein kinase PknB [Urbifossiella limnaea]
MNPPLDPQPNPADDPDRTTDLPAAPDTPRAADTPRDPAPADDPLGTGAHVPSGDTDPLATGAYRDTDPASPGVPGAPAVPGYVILGELGKGGMGVVYKARQTGLNRVVALKMILAGPHAAPAAVARFLSEARAVARFQHPNVVQIFDVGEAAGLPYFALEFVDGPTLAKQIGRAPTPPAYAAAVAEELARAVAYAHAQGVVHRDLKPANVLLAPDGTAKVTDFGLAKYDDDSGQTQTGQILGTPSYMAPEQAEGRDDVGPPADVYALGAILYDLLTGRPPFVGASAIDTISQVRTREPVPPRQLAAGVPRDLETVCLKCLQKDPARRYASAAAVADDLRRFRAGEPIVARPVSAAEKAWRWARRNPVGALAAALAAVVFFGGPVVAWQMYQLAGSERTARTQAEQDRDAKEKARAAEEVAKVEAVRNATAAYNQQNHALKTIRTVLLSVDDMMRDKASLAPVRLKVLDAMLKELNEVKVIAARDPFQTEDGRVLPPGRMANQNEAVGKSRIGETYLKAGKVDEAGPWLAEALKVYRVELAAVPDEPHTLRNVAALANMNSDVKLRLGDAAAARALRAESLKLRQERLKILTARSIAADKKQQDTAENVRLLAAEDVATSFRLIADVDVLLGDPAAAVEGYLAAEAAFAALPEERRRLLRVRRERAAVQDWLGDARVKTGDPAAAEACYRAALAEREELARVTNHPVAGPVARADAALSRMTLGDFFLTVRNQRGAAAAEYAAAHREFAALNKLDPDSLPVRRGLGHTHYRLGGTATDPTEAKAHFADALKVREVLGKIDPKDTQAQFELLTALGRVGRAADAEKLADRLKALAPRDPRVLFQVACGLSVAAGGTTGADAARLRDKTLDALDRLAAAGWRDGHALDTDPDLAAVRADPRFAAVRAKVPAPKR